MEHQTEGLEGGECDAAQLGDTIFKDCNTTCSGDGCNDNNDVELLFSDLDENGDPVQIRSSFIYFISWGHNRLFKNLRSDGILTRVIAVMRFDRLPR